MLGIKFEPISAAEPTVKISLNVAGVSLISMLDGAVVTEGTEGTDAWPSALPTAVAVV